MAAQTPPNLKNCGRIRSESTVKTNVRLKEIIAEILQFESAVKKPEEQMLKPLNRKLMAKI